MEKNPFRVFGRATAAYAMKALGVEPSDISGENRSSYNARVLDFDTFESLSDPVEYFAEAMTTELEHGSAGASLGTDLTGDDAMSTARIVAAHLLGVEFGRSEAPLKFPTYYDFLWWIEGLHDRAVSQLSRQTTSFVN